MTYWRHYNLQNVSGIFLRGRNMIFDDNIYTLDMEVTSLFGYPSGYDVFNYELDPKSYVEVDKIGVMYIWQFSINESVLFGRTLPELLEFLQSLRKQIPIGRIIVYIHNLSYEFQFLRNIINDFEVFARKPRHPMKAVSKSLNIEFRCSLMLTNMSLEKLPGALSLPVFKQVGKLDYNVLRLPCTPLTDDELLYCEYDCIVLYYAIEKYKKEYGSVHNIPLTQTGKLRRIVKKIYKNNTSYYRKLSKILPVTYSEFNLLCSAYSGGYTHANALYAGEILENVYSYDITSSYPTVMVAEKFPMSRFIPSRIRDIRDLKSDTGYIIDITFENLQAIISCTYLSKSKAKEIYDCIEDNGRVVTAKKARYIITDVDLKIIEQAYKFTYTINGCYSAYMERLDTSLVKYILQLYSDKTTYKDVEGKEELYKRSKEYINSMYGMAVTNMIRDDVEFGVDWTIKPLTISDVEDKLIKLTKRGKTFMNYSWGVWVTAYARYNLWSVILKMHNDVVYTDTDSIKFINKNNIEYFNEYNKEITNKLMNAVEYHELSEDLINPKDPKGRSRPLGVYDKEPTYDKFITLGAKKYCTEKNSSLSITISGVRKSGVIALSSIEDFTPGMTFEYNTSGRLIMTYTDCQPELTIQDYFGESYTIVQKYGINAMPTSYTLGISADYEDYLILLSGRSSTHATIINGKEVY